MIDTVEKSDLKSLLEDSPSCEGETEEHEDLGISCSEDVAYIVSACFGETLVCENLGRIILHYIDRMTCTGCGKKANDCGSVRPI